MFRRAATFLRGLQGKREDPLTMGDTIMVTTPGSCWHGYTGTIVSIAVRKDDPDHPLYWVKLNAALFPQMFRGHEIMRLTGDDS